MWALLKWVAPPSLYTGQGLEMISGFAPLVVQMEQKCHNFSDQGTAALNGLINWTLHQLDVSIQVKGLISSNQIFKEAVLTAGWRVTVVE